MSIPPDSRPSYRAELPSAPSATAPEGADHRHTSRTPTRPSHAKRRDRGTLLGSVPVVRKSYVVEIESTEGDASEITARIRPTKQAAAALVVEGFRLSDTILDLVSNALVEIAREEEEKEP